jgi:hypothetical protein
VSRAARRLSLVAVIAAAPVLALAGRQVTEGIHGSPEPGSYWSFTVDTSFGERTPDVDDVTIIRLDEESRTEDFLWGGGLAAAGAVLLILGVRGLRRSTPSG